MLCHISVGVEQEEKKFVPRVPKYRLDGENNEVKRVCMANSVEACFNGFPYIEKFLKRSNYMEYFLSVYSVKEDYENVLTSNELDELGLVPDAKITGECWFLKEFNATPDIIRIKEIDALWTGEKVKTLNHTSGIITFDSRLEGYERNEVVYILEHQLDECIKMLENHNYSHSIGLTNEEMITQMDIFDLNDYFDNYLCEHYDDDNYKEDFEEYLSTEIMKKVIPINVIIRKNQDALPYWTFIQKCLTDNKEQGILLDMLRGFGNFKFDKEFEYNQRGY